MNKTSPLAQKIAEAEAKQNHRLNQALASFESDLKQRLKVVESTINTDIRTVFQNQTKALETQAQQLEARMQSLIYKLLLVPTITMLFLGCLMAAGLWLWNKNLPVPPAPPLPWQVQNMQMKDGKIVTYQVIPTGGWTLCNMGTEQKPIERPCRRAQ